MRTDNHIEEWRGVVGYEGYYQVSNMGQIFSKRTSKILRPWKDKDGYPEIYLCVNGTCKAFKTYKLVMLAFPDICGEYFEGAECNHKDEDHMNCCAWNLEWCTRKYNCRYGTRNRRTALKQNKPILQYTTDGVLVREWETSHDIERETGWSRPNITKCAQGKYKSAYGYIWRYK